MAKDMLIVASKLKEVIKKKNFQSSGDIAKAVSSKVHAMIEEAMLRAKKNGRTTIRAYDL